MGSPIEIIVGTDSTYNGTVWQADGLTAFTGYSSGDPLTVKLWMGQDQPVISGPTATWNDVTQGTFFVVFPNSLTTTLSSGIYRLLITVAHSGGIYTVLNGSVKVIGGPGLASTLTYYITYQDLKDDFSTIEELVNPESDDAGFLKQRAEARAWIETLGQKHYKASVYLDDNQFVYFTNFLSRDGRRSIWLDQQYAANYLIMSEELTRAQACYALSRIFKSQIGKDKDGIYADLGRRYALMAATQASLLTLEFDINSDGYSDFSIQLGCHDTLRG